MYMLKSPEICEALFRKNLMYNGSKNLIKLNYNAFFKNNAKSYATLKVFHRRKSNYCSLNFCLASRQRHWYHRGVVNRFYFAQLVIYHVSTYKNAVFSIILREMYRINCLPFLVDFLQRQV